MVILNAEEYGYRTESKGHRNFSSWALEALTGNSIKSITFWIFLAPQVGLEPTTLRLTAECSAIELLRSNGVSAQIGGELS